MRIGIDARFLGPAGKGLGRYSFKLVTELEKLDDEHEYFIFVRAHNYDAYVPANPRFHKVLADVPWYTVNEQVRFARILYEYKLDLVHFLHFNVPILYRRPYIVTVHDLILLEYPTRKASPFGTLLYWGKHFAYRLVIQNAVVTAKQVITISNFTKQVIERRLKTPAQKIRRIYVGVDDHPFPPTNAEDVAEHVPEIGSAPYLLYVGNAYPHKNVEGLVRVFSRLLKDARYQSWKLVLVGKEDYFFQRIRQLVKELGISENVVFTGFVSDTILGELYQNCRLYVFPSLYEGFGLPPLEALASGAPIFISDKTSLPEVCGDVAEYFSPGDEGEWLARLKEVLENLDAIRDSQQEQAPRLLAQYSWRDMAKATLTVYNEQRPPDSVV